MTRKSNIHTGQGNAAITWLVVLLLAVAASLGWYQYFSLSESSKQNEAENRQTVAVLEHELENTRHELDSLANQNRSLTEDSQQFLAQAGLIAQLEKEKEVLAASLQSETDARQTMLEENRQLRAQMQQMLKEVTEHTDALQDELSLRQDVESRLTEQVSESSAEKQALLQQLRSEQARREQLQKQISHVNSAIDDKSTELAAARKDVSSLQATIDEIRRQKQQEAEQFNRLKSMLESELNESRVQITQLKNRMTVINLSNEVLFNSGSAELKSAGRKVLSLIATTLNQYPGRLISIEGHTDNVPIGPNSAFSSNWELSSARALAALQHLQGDSQVAPERLRIVGHGEFSPVADNNSAEGRAKNRRIEIRLMPELQESFAG